LDKQTTKFILYIKETLHDNKVKLDLSKSKYVVLNSDKIRCSGYFDGDNKILRCAINKPETEWIPILVHEYAHFTQWEEQCDVWTKMYLNGEDQVEKFFLWLSHKKEMDDEAVQNAVKTIQLLELDCEKRAIKIFKKFNLPICRETYTQKANSYVYFYNYAMIKRKWYSNKTKKPPYETSSIYSNLPKKFTFPMPEKYFKLYDEYYGS